MLHVALAQPGPTPAAEALARVLHGMAEASWETWTVDSARQSAEPAGIQLILADITAPALDPATFLALLRRLGGPPVLGVFPTSWERAKLDCALAGVDDFVFEPHLALDLPARIRRLARPRSGLQESTERLICALAQSRLIGRSPAFLRALESLPKVARSGLTLLITGETGTGKELCARAVHQMSPRRSFPFVAVDCSVLPEHLFENELFGHARGAYTDAREEQRGLVAVAEGGTLFLDEIDALALTTQAKLLRLVQEKTYRLLGSERILRADVNIVAAANVDLRTAVRERRFRADLYYRLGVLEIRLPPLRERSSDVPLLAKHFLDEIAADHDSAVRFAPEALRRLESHTWPGNVRELENVVRRAAVLSDDAVIEARHLDFEPAEPAEPESPPAIAFGARRQQVIDEFERRFLQDVMRRHAGNLSRAARAAGRDRSAFRRLLKRHGLRREDF
jgi:two-component system, NtrC family, response regulator GlrR